MNLGNFRLLKIISGLTLLVVFSYNFFIAYQSRFEINGDATEFLGLGLSLAEFQKYGKVEFSHDLKIMEAFQMGQVEKGKFHFIGHSTWRPPVWPFLIASIFFIFGYNLIYLLIFKFFLHLLGIFVFFKTLKLLTFKRSFIVIGVLLYGINPAWQLYSRFFLSEPITLFFITLWLYFLIKYIKTGRSFYPQAILGGLIILSHPYFFFLPFSVWSFLYFKKVFKFKFLSISAIICCVLLSIWIVRNHIVLETDVLLVTTSSGAVMAKGWNKNVIHDHTNTMGDLADETLVLNSPTMENFASLGEVDKMESYSNATWDFITANPEMVLPIIGKKLKSAFNPFPETPKKGFLQTARWIFQFLSLLALIYILFFSKDNLIRSLGFGLILSTILITIITFSGFRFRMPQSGLEIIYILTAIGDLYQRKIKVRNSRNQVTEANQL